jgi:3-deoxy-D-manno-octulosonate 8-phosphate phosphatase (KDO 8-P phosphatase)
MRYQIAEDEIRERARLVELLLLDCDGVLTDGTAYLLPDGEEIKRFDVQDGHGIVLWRRAGFEVGILSGRGGRALERRVEELKIEYLVQRSLDKLASFTDFLAETGYAPEAICYAGDDVVDIPLLRRAGLAVAPPSAVPETLAVAHMITTREAGRGAVREIVDFLLKANGRWDELMKRYLA